MMMLIPVMMKLGLICLGMGFLKILTIKSMFIGKISILMTILNGLKQFLTPGYDFGKNGLYGYDNGFGAGVNDLQQSASAAAHQLAYKRVYHRY